jgi:hypothetical protein
VQQFETFCVRQLSQKGHTSDIAAWSAEACSKTDATGSELVTNT